MALRACVVLLSASCCCWLITNTGAMSPPTVNGAATAYSTPVLTRVGTIAADPTGHLRDPSPAVRDAAGTWHFWVDYIPLSQGTQSGWHAFLHHYTAPAITGPWTNQGLALNWSTDPNDYDSWGTFSSSAIYSASEGLWYLFYTGTSLANYTQTLTSAQLVASATAPGGPWTRHGLVCWPVGAPPSWNQSWNARRCDSGRALVVDGVRGYWTKGVAGASFAQEGVYFPLNGSSFAPPWAEWPGNPVYNASSSGSPGSADGYENCEFFRGPAAEPGGPWLHVLCQNHGSGQPHFVTKDGLHWTFLGELDTAPALEPTPAYDSAEPGDVATVEYFIARAEDGSQPNLHIDLFALVWQ
jgi:hypothetical protein